MMQTSYGIKKFAISILLFNFFSFSAFGLTLQEVETALKDNPKVNWKAKVIGNGEVFQVPVGGFGLRVKEKDPLLQIFSQDLGEVAQNLPSFLDWRNVNGQNWISPVKNQGYCGSCVFFATAGLFEAQLNISSGKPINVDLSEQFLLENKGSGSCFLGAHIGDGLAIFRDHGVPDEVCFPYTSGRNGEEEGFNQTCSDWESRVYKSIDRDITHGYGIKLALQNGPVLTDMTVFADFLYYKEGVYEHIIGEELGGHAVLLIGYDDKNDAWIVKNSWGEDWGENGFFKIKRNDVSGIALEGYTVITDKLDKTIKLSNPEYLAAATRETELEIKNFYDKNLLNAHYEVYNRQNREIRLSGEFNLTTMKALIDTAKLPDGLYEIKVDGTYTDNSTTQKPWYSTSILVNNVQDIKINLLPEFNSDFPVSDRVYFLVDIDYKDVPLTEVRLVLSHQSSHDQKTISAKYPGKITKIGWRSGAFPSGKYDIYVKGSIGTVQSFESNHVTAIVK